MSEKYNKVLEFVKKKHAGQIRRSGEPVVNHPIGVAEILRKSGYGEDYQIVGLCHDLLEDTDTTIEELRELIGDEAIIQGIISLTKTDEMSLEESINNAAADPYGRVIKGADRLQNAMTTYTDKNTQEFISGFIFKSMAFYVPKLREVNNPYLEDLLAELRRLYSEMVPEAVSWVNNKLAEKNVENVLAA